MIKQNILITGASGYLGGVITKELHSTGLYNCILGTRKPEVLKSNDILKHLETRPFNISLIETFNSTLKNIDVVVHLVSLSNQECERNPELAQKINTDFARDLIEASINANVKQFIYLSTFHVYGITAGQITEETQPKPLSVYAQTHLETEKILLKKIEEGKIEGAVIRLSNAMGAPVTEAKDAWALVANDLCRQAVQNKTLTINSSGFQKRDFIAVSCIGQAIDILIKKAELVKDITPIFNLGSEKTITILELAHKIQNACQQKLGFHPSLVRKIEKDSLEQPSFTYCTDKLRMLGFEIKTTIEEEIENTLLSLKKS